MSTPRRSRRVRELRWRAAMTAPRDRVDVSTHGEELALLVEAVEDYAIFALSATGEIRSWNRGAARIMGYSSAEAVGRHFSIVYPPEDLAAGKPSREIFRGIEDRKMPADGFG